MEIIYEDGLRLSELYGQLAGAEFAVDHILTTFYWAFILMGIFAVFVAVSVAMGTHSLLENVECIERTYVEESDKPKDTFLYTWNIWPEYEWLSRFDGVKKLSHYEARSVMKSWTKSIPLMVSIIPIILLEIVVFIIAQDFANKDVLQIEAQIEAILSKYQ